MTGLNTCHTFHATKADGSTVLSLYRRIDLHEVALVAVVALIDRSAQPAFIGDRLCEALDRERLSRAG